MSKKTNLEILAYENTPLGPLCLRRRELLSQPGTLVTEVTLNHEFLMSSLYTDSERALAEFALRICTESQLRVLVGGLGLGYTAWEVLKSTQVQTVEVVEYLPEVIQWLARDLLPLSSALNNESRLSVKQGDVYARLANPPTTPFDAILIDVDHSPDERLDDSSGSFYTEPGIIAAKKHLTSEGVLGVWSCAADPEFEQALRNQFANVRVESVTYENQLVNERPTDWLYFASGQRGLSAGEAPNCRESKGSPSSSDVMAVDDGHAQP